MNSKLIKAGNFLEYIFLSIAVVCIWQYMEYIGSLNPVTLPSPEMIYQKFIDMIISGALTKHLLISTGRVLQGFAMAAVSAITLGLVLGLSKRCYRITDLIIQLVRPIPPIAWIPLVILWFGVGEESKIFLIFLGGFFAILINVIDGVHRIDPKLIEVARVMETPKMKYIFHLIIPAALPSIFTGLRVGMASCWMCVVAAELVASSTGLGYMIMNARQFSQTPVVIVGMITIGIIGKLTDSILKEIERRVIKWS